MSRAALGRHSSGLASSPKVAAARFACAGQFPPLDPVPAALNFAYARPRRSTELTKFPFLEPCRKTCSAAPQSLALGCGKFALVRKGAIDTLLALCYERQDSSEICGCRDSLRLRQCDQDAVGPS